MANERDGDPGRTWSSASEAPSTRETSSSATTTTTCCGPPPSTRAWSSRTSTLYVAEENDAATEGRSSRLTWTCAPQAARDTPLAARSSSRLSVNCVQRWHLGASHVDAAGLTPTAARCASRSAPGHTTADIGAGCISRSANLAGGNEATEVAFVRDRLQFSRPFRGYCHFQLAIRRLLDRPTGGERPCNCDHPDSEDSQ